jgi:DnaJ-class molecular chaperone
MPAIKRVYRMELKRHHPDMVPASNGAASSRFCEILDAFAVLSDPVLRAAYDTMVAERRKVKAAAPPSRGVALARAGVAIVQLAYMGGLALLLLLIAIVAVVEIVTGK